MHPEWTILHKNFSIEGLGFLPSFLDTDNPRSAKQQIDDNYRHGGGWSQMKGFTRSANDVLQYPGDPPLAPLAATHLRDERIVFYKSSWVAIFQPDDSFEVARID